MSVNLEIIHQIKNGNDDAKKMLLAKQKSTIDNIYKNYSYAFVCEEIAEKIRLCFDDCLNNFDFPEQNFALYFSFILKNRFDTSLNLKINQENAEEIISSFINQGEEKEIIEDIIEDLKHIALLLRNIDKNKLDYIFEQLLINNQRLYKYLKTFAEQSNVNFENIILRKLLAKYKQTAMKMNINDYSDNYKIFMPEVIQYPLLNNDEIKELFIKYEQAKKDGDKVAEKDIKDELVNSNIKLVLHIARDYTKRGLDIMDLIQEGSLGLIRAIELYDYSLGYTFSTYSHPWIKQMIIRAIEGKTKNIVIPYKVSSNFFNFKKKMANLANELGRTPTWNEIKNSMGLDDKTMAFYLDLLNTNTVSLSTPSGFADGELGERVKDDEHHRTDYVATDNLNKEEIIIGILSSKLTEQEKIVLLLRFGFTSNRIIYTLEEIGTIYNLTRERIRQIETKAKLKIKHDPIFIASIDPNIIPIEIENNVKNKSSNHQHYRTENIDCLKKHHLAKSNELVWLKEYSNQEYINLVFEIDDAKFKNILFLKTGFFNDMFFSNESVAQFLSISKKDIDNLVAEAFSLLDGLHIGEPTNPVYQL